MYIFAYVIAQVAHIIAYGHIRGPLFGFVWFNLKCVKGKTKFNYEVRTHLMLANQLSQPTSQSVQNNNTLITTCCKAISVTNKQARYHLYYDFDSKQNINIRVVKKKWQNVRISVAHLLSVKFLK